jgi:hypothetical protein
MYSFNLEIYYYGKNSKNAYYSRLWKAYLFDYYKNESFPMFGWYKPCYYCNHITTSYITKHHMCKKVIIHACKKCIKKYKKHIGLNKKLNEYIFRAKYF